MFCREIEKLTGFETRETVLGYIQRGSPSPYDRNLGTLFGGLPYNSSTKNLDVWSQNQKRNHGCSS